MITMAKDLVLDAVVAFAVFLLVGVAAHRQDPSKGICGPQETYQSAAKAPTK